MKKSHSIGLFLLALLLSTSPLFTENLVSASELSVANKQNLQQLSDQLSIQRHEIDQLTDELEKSISAKNYDLESELKVREAIMELRKAQFHLISTEVSVIDLLEEKNSKPSHFSKTLKAIKNTVQTCSQLFDNVNNRCKSLKAQSGN